MLVVVVAQVSDAKLPVYEGLTLACAITYPIKVHVDHFRLFLFDGVNGKVIDGILVHLDWSGRQWVTNFKEQGAYQDGLLVVDLGGSNFGSSSRTHYV